MAQTDRRFRHLDDLRGRKFVSVEHGAETDSLESCYGCSRILSRHHESASSKAFVTSVAPAKPWHSNEVLWVRAQCFEEFRSALAFEADSTLNLNDVFGEIPLGPRI